MRKFTEYTKPSVLTSILTAESLSDLNAAVNRGRSFTRASAGTRRRWARAEVKRRMELEK